MVRPLFRDQPPATVRLVVALADYDFKTAVEEACRATDGIEVVASVSTSAALVRVATALAPDVCLIDRDMPEAAGATWETRTRLPQTKIVLIGDGSSDEELFAALRTGVEGFLFKDMNVERLPSAIVDVSRGHAALPRNLAARVMTAMRESGPTWRAVGPRSARCSPDHSRVGGARAARAGAVDTRDCRAPDADDRSGPLAHLGRPAEDRRDRPGRSRQVPARSGGAVGVRAFALAALAAACATMLGQAATRSMSAAGAQSPTAASDLGRRADRRTGGLAARAGSSDSAGGDPRQRHRLLPP